MASSLAQSTVHAGNKLLQNIKGNKCLNSTGKTAAVNTVCATAIQIMLSQSQSHSLRRRPSHSHSLHQNQSLSQR